MLKKICNVLKKIVFGICLLYGYNILIENVWNIIPLNVFTIGSVSIFGIPGLFSLVFIQKMMF